MIAWSLLQRSDVRPIEVDREGIAVVVGDLQRTDGQALFGFVRRLGLTDDQADDVVQEVLARLLAELGRGILVVNPRSWAFQSVYRLAMDQHRLRRRVAGLVDRLGSMSPRSMSADDRIVVWGEVDRLPVRQRQVLYLRYRADLTHDEIGQVLGISSSASRSHATQAIATLRARLAIDIVEIEDR